MLHAAWLHSFQTPPFGSLWKFRKLAEFIEEACAAAWQCASRWGLEKSLARCREAQASRQQL
jgi:hypothetical protein